MLRGFWLFAQAEEELAGARRRYDRDQPGRGLRFAERVEEVIEHALAQPDAGTLVIHRRVKRTIRKYQVTKFPYDVVATVQDEELVVLAVSHHKRRPGYWIRRLKSL